VYLVSNADKFKYYERWATANYFPTENIINDSTTSHSERLGPVGDFDLVLRSKKVTEDVMVVAGDMLFEEGFDISSVIRFFRDKDGEVALYYPLPQNESKDKHGIIDIDRKTNRITKSYPPRCSSGSSSRLAYVVFAIFRASSTHLFQVPAHLPAYYTTTWYYTTTTHACYFCASSSSPGLLDERIIVL
jgi:glucuronokinase